MVNNHNDNGHLIVTGQNFARSHGLTQDHRQSDLDRRVVPGDQRPGRTAYDADV